MKYLVTACLAISVAVCWADEKAATSASAGEPVLDLQTDGTMCTGRIEVPRGSTIYLANTYPGDSTMNAAMANAFLCQTVPMDSPLEKVPYVFRFGYSREDTKDASVFCVSHAYSIASPVKLMTSGSSTGGGGLSRMSVAKGDVAVVMTLKMKTGTRVIARNQVHEIAAWNARWGAIKENSVLKILVVDSPALAHRLGFDQKEPETLRWSSANLINRLQNDPGPAPPGKDGIDLTIAPVPIDLPRGAGENQYYLLRSIPGQVIQVNLLVNDQLDPDRHLVLSLVNGTGTLTSHVELVDGTLQYTADLETGGQHRLFTYTKTYAVPVSYSLFQPGFSPAFYQPLYAKINDLDCMAPYPTPNFAKGESVGTSFDTEPGEHTFFLLNGKRWTDPRFPTVRLQVGLQE